MSQKEVGELVNLVENYLEPWKLVEKEMIVGVILKLNLNDRTSNKFKVSKLRKFFFEDNITQIFHIKIFILNIYR